MTAAPATLSAAVPNHPNRSKVRTAGSTPKPAEIAAARAAAGLTQRDAADRIYGSLRAWEDWESGRRPMHPGLFELFLIKTGQPTGA